MNITTAAINAAEAAWQAARLIDDRLGAPDANRMRMWAAMFTKADLTDPSRAAQAVVTWYEPGRDRVIQPGDVISQYRADARRPCDAPVADVLKLNSAPPASAERRAQLMDQIRALANRKAMP